jgi:uncharacterized membrane protein YbhN (UPF0104 family)
MFGSIGQFCKNYYDQIPLYTFKTAACSAAITFAICITVVRGPSYPRVDLSRAGSAATIAVVATLIHALTTPLFNYIFDTNGQSFNGYKELCRFFINVGFTQILINHTTPFKIGLLDGVTYKHNFLCVPGTLQKIASDVLIVAADLLEIGIPSRNTLQTWFDFNTNPTPYYIVI